MRSTIAKALRTMLAGVLAVPILAGTLALGAVISGNVPVAAAVTYGCNTVGGAPTIGWTVPATTTTTTPTISWNGLSCSHVSWGTYQYAYILISLNGASTGTWIAAGALNSGYNVAGSHVVDFTLNGGNANQGAHTIWLAVVVCTGNTGTAYPTFYSNPYAALPAGNCTYAPSWTSRSIVYDTGPSAPTVSYPTSTLYTNATSGAVTWNASSDVAGIATYYVNYHWATLSNGSCVSQGADSGWQSVGNVTSWSPGWGPGTCFQYQVLAQNNYGQQTAGGWSAWIESDQTIPTFRGSINSTTFTPGQTVTLTQSGSSDANPSVGMSGNYCYDNNGSGCAAWVTSNTASYTVPTPTLGTQANYTISGTAIDNTWTNYAWTNYTYCVDNTFATGLSLTGVPATTNSTTVSVITHSTAGGCAGITDVEISNSSSGPWANGKPANGTISNWDFTSATYGGTSSQGSHTIYVQFFEGSTWTRVNVSVTYDTTAPSAPSAPALAAASDTGSSSTDGLTSIANGLLFSGTSEQSATVVIHYNGNTDTTTASAVDGTWSITTTHPLSTGVYSVTVTVTDTAGNSSAPSPGKTIIIHLTCPN